MVLRDSLFRSMMTYEDWTDSTRPKVQGTWNIHQALEGARAAVDFFIVLSSFTVIYGGRGMANYAGGAAPEDAVAHFRRAKVLPAMTLDVGIMRDIGVLAEQGTTQGFRDEEVPYGLDKEERGGGSDESKGDVQARLAGTDSLDAGAAVILEGLVDFVAKMLHTTAAEIDMYRFIHSYGTDSLVAIELVNWAKKECRPRLTVFDIMAAVPITELAKKIVVISALLQHKEATEA